MASEERIKDKKSSYKRNTELELQLADIIHIIAPKNEKINNKTFIIDYIDKRKSILINTDTLDKIELKIAEDGIIDEGRITRIALLSRSDTPSYALQNNLVPGEWINIFFTGDVPIVIIGEITNLENDMIEIKTLENDTIYINFDYKGIPDNLPIQLIEIREKPLRMQEECEDFQGPEKIRDKKEDKLEEGELEEDKLEEDKLEEDKLEEGEIYESNPPTPEKMTKKTKRVKFGADDDELNTNEFKEQLTQLIISADQVQFGDEEYGFVTQLENVSQEQQRYSLETQLNDLLDELLSTVPNIQRTPRVLNNIHVMIERFKQLRSKFSSFDSLGNIDGKLVKEANYKPLVEFFEKFNINLYWILSVVKNTKKVYDAESIDEEYSSNDLEYIDLTSNLSNMKDILNSYKSNILPYDQNAYSALYKDLNPYFTPFEQLNEETSSEDRILIEKEVKTNLNTIVENLLDMYSSIYSRNNIRSKRFVIQKYNLALTKLNTIDSTGGRLVTVRTNITENDMMSVKSFLTLPEPVIRFSKINLPGTNILDRVNLNSVFLNYWQLLKTNTKINPRIIDSLDKEIQFHEDNFANSIKNYVLSLNSSDMNGLSRDEIYQKFANIIVPKTRVLFNLMKKYIDGKLSIIDVVAYLEPFLVYSDDLTYMQFKEIVEFIDKKIVEYNQSFNSKRTIFRRLLNTRSRFSSLSMTKAYSIIEVLHRDIREQVFDDGYHFIEPEKIFTNSEILRKITIKDYGRLYTSAISLQNIPYMFPSDYSSFFDKEKLKLDDKLIKETENPGDKCHNYIISKYYTSIENLQADNDTTIYFDKRYDKTNYGVLEDNAGYAKQVLTMTPDELRIFIKSNLMEKKQMTEEDAEYLANTLVDGHKKVKNGQFALLYKGYDPNYSKEVEYYIRENDKWVLDTETELNDEDIYTDDPTILCNLQKNCMSVEDKCEPIKKDELLLQTKLLKDVINEFDNKYHLSKKELEDTGVATFAYCMNVIDIITRMEMYNYMLKYNIQKYKLGLISEEERQNEQISPYSKLLQFILGQHDFVKTQKDIIQFVSKFTRQSINGLGPLNEFENSCWLYCIKTNVTLLPVFRFELAKAFIVGGSAGYMRFLNILKSQAVTSDDSDKIFDKNTGWVICETDFDIEEGYEEGFKLVTRAVMEEDAGNKVMGGLAEKPFTYDTPETKMINNIINTLSIAMGIHMETQKEFIIKNVQASLRKKVDKSKYETKAAEMASLKGVKMDSFSEFYNSSLLYYTFGMFLIAVQTAIPSIKTKKTYPGCIRSFLGYPFEGGGDLSGLNYLGCIAYDIRSSGEPWNSLNRKKQETITTNIKKSIDDVFMKISVVSEDIQRKFEEKREYLLTTTPGEISQENDISKWLQFLPPLLPYKITHLANITQEFKDSLFRDLKDGSKNQQEKILVIESKIIQFSLAIIEKIQDIVKKEQFVLATANNEPYLENACCQSKEYETTISYFNKKDPRISEYNQVVTHLSTMIETITNYSMSDLFYSDINTKNIYPSVITEFSEKTIYLAFIRFCKFNSFVPIPKNLVGLCDKKPLISYSNSLERVIQQLVEEGRIYTDKDLLKLLQIVSRNNIININFNTPKVSSVTKLLRLLKSIDGKTIDTLSIDEESGEVMEDKYSDETDKEFYGLVINVFDTFELAYVENRDTGNKQFTKATEDLNNFLLENIDYLNETVLEFIRDNIGSVSVARFNKMVRPIKNLSKWVSDDVKEQEDIKGSEEKSNANFTNILNFYENFIQNFSVIFPNIILNRVDYDNLYIPHYYGFSISHDNKLKKNVSEYYSNLKPFYGDYAIQKLLINIQRTTQNLVSIAKYTPSFSSLYTNDKIIKPHFDERTSRLLFEYYLLKLMYQFVQLSENEDMIVTEISKPTDQTDLLSVEYFEDQETKSDLSFTTRQRPDIVILTSGNKRLLKQKTAELLVVFCDILGNEKEEIDITYDMIKDRVFKLKEREKDLFTDRLKSMTDEERNVDTILKINKLSMYGKGLQKGLTVYDKEFYDDEQGLREEMLKYDEKNRKSGINTDGEQDLDLIDDIFGGDSEIDLEETAVYDEDMEAYDDFDNEDDYDGIHTRDEY